MDHRRVDPGGSGSWQSALCRAWFARKSDRARSPGPGVATPSRAPRVSHRVAFLPVVRRPPMLRAGSVCSSTRRTASPPALLILVSVRGQARRFLSLFVRTAFPSWESKTPASCRFLSAPWQSHPCPPGPAEWLPPAPVLAWKTAPQGVAPSRKEILIVLKNFAFCFLADQSCPTTSQTSGLSRQSLLPVFFSELR